MVKSNTTTHKGLEKAMERQLNEVQKLACGVTRQIAEARNYYAKGGGDAGGTRKGVLCDMVVEAAYRSESMTEKARRLVLEVTGNDERYGAYMEELVRMHDIGIGYQNGVLTASLPFLIPHRKNPHTDYLYKPLHAALKNWLRDREERMEEMPHYGECTVAFLHVYDERLPLARVRDHDNIEEKHVLDALCNFVIRSDNGLDLNTYHETKMGAEDRTHVTVMESKNFIKWLQNG